LLDNQFDPYEKLLELDHTLKQVIRAHNDLASKVIAQEEVIEVLLKGLNAANKANQQMLENGLANLYTNFNASGQH
jgi:hypothetical protein